MSELNFIGINKEHAAELGMHLDQLLCNYQIFYQNLRSFHWNIRGSDFFELHIKFEEYYNDARMKIDEIAERILTLGLTPTHRLSDYVANSSIKESKNILNGREAVKITLENLKALIIKERSILSLASEYSDEGTLSQMSDYITQQEKTVWMLNAYLG